MGAIPNESPNILNVKRNVLCRLWGKLSPVGKFIILFLVMLVIVGIITSQLLSRFHEKILWLMSFTASAAGGILSLFSSQVSYHDVTVVFKGFPVEIIDECTGLFEIFIFMAAVLAYSTSIKKKLLGFAMGIPTIYLFNVIRIIFLLVAGAYSKELFDFMHLYFWQGTLIIMISSVWVAWLYLVVYHEKKPAPLSH
jgi:archaeosortase B (VPXXXP-CTERM-specific)